MPRDFFPRRNAEAVLWSANFVSKVVLRPLDFGVTPELAAECAVLQQAFAMWHQLASDPSTAAPAARTARGSARAALEVKLRGLVNLVRAHPGITAQMLAELGLEQHHRGRGPRTLRPAEAPLVRVDKVVATTVHLRLMERATAKRRKPGGVGGAMIFGFVGEWPPADLREWQFIARTTRTLCKVTFRGAGPVGSKLWIVARWENTRCEPGPVCQPVMTRVQDGILQRTSLKLAA